MSGWVGVDLDGTLAFYEVRTDGVIGRPIPAMVERVRAWVSQGIEVRIFTARISDPDRRVQVAVTEAIDAWCEQHIGQKLPITCKKDFSCIKIYDDRAVQVEHNTGRLIGEDE